MVNRQRTRTRLELDERRSKLLELGRSLFGKHSYDELSIERIAKLAGVSKGLLYHYFPTKRDFYVETVRAAAGEMLRLTDAAPGTPPGDILLHALDAYLRYAEDNATAYVSLLRGGVGVDAEVAAIVEDVRQTFVRRIVGQLGIPRPAAKQRLALYGWVGFVEAISLEWLQHRSLSRAELCRFLAGQLTLSVASLGLVPKKNRLALLAGLKGLLK